MPEDIGRSFHTPAEDRVRRTRLIVQLPGFDAIWRSAENCSIADPSPDLVALVDGALRALGLEQVGALALIRHEAGESGFPNSATEGPVGFTIELTDGGQTIDGGLLLFVDKDQRVVGWRSEAGTLTTWQGADPLITELAPGAPTRVALFGRARLITDSALQA